MPKLFYLQSAKSDFAQIASYIRRESGSIVTARKFIRSLQLKCERLAEIQGIIGRSRPELGSAMRSSTHRGYIIYFRYVDNVFEVTNILEGHRDAASHFGLDAADESETDDD